MPVRITETETETLFGCLTLKKKTVIVHVENGILTLLDVNVAFYTCLFLVYGYYNTLVFTQVKMH